MGFLFEKRASGSKGRTNGVIVLHRFQWCCFCLHPGPVGRLEGEDGRREWPGLSRSVCFNVSFSNSRLVVSSEAGFEYRTNQSRGLHAVRGRWFLFTMMLYFKVLVSTQPMVHPSCTSHLPAVSHLLSKTDMFSTISAWTCHLLSLKWNAWKAHSRQATLTCAMVPRNRFTSPWKCWCVMKLCCFTKA